MLIGAYRDCNAGKEAGITIGILEQGTSQRPQLMLVEFANELGEGHMAQCYSFSD